MTLSPISSTLLQCNLGILSTERWNLHTSLEFDGPYQCFKGKSNAWWLPRLGYIIWCTILFARTLELEVLSHHVRSVAYHGYQYAVRKPKPYWGICIQVPWSKVPAGIPANHQYDTRHMSQNTSRWVAQLPTLLSWNHTVWFQAIPLDSVQIPDPQHL